MLRLKTMKGLPLLIASALLLDVPRAVPQSLDVALGGYGLSFGNSRRITGVRVNLIDHQVERVTGLNLTLWTPKANPNALGCPETTVRRYAAQVKQE